MRDDTQIAGSEHALHLSSNYADELTTQIPDWDVELTQLQPGRFNGELTVISLGPVLICRGKFDRPLLQHVAGLTPMQYVRTTRLHRARPAAALHGREPPLDFRDRVG